MTWIRIGTFVWTMLTLSIVVQAQQGCSDCRCSGQWQTELIPPYPERTIVASVEERGENRHCATMYLDELCLGGFEGIQVTGSGCENLDWGWDFWIRNTLQHVVTCLEQLEVGPCQSYYRRIENVREDQKKVYKCISESGSELCREERERVKYFFAKYQSVVSIPGCRCKPLPLPLAPGSTVSVN
jgi:hypothetical protein